MSQDVQMPARAPELQRAADEERRVFAAPLRDLEWREGTGTGDGSFTLSGHAAVFDQLATLYSGRSWLWQEKVARGAFTGVLASRPDVHFNHGHDMTRAMARTGINGVGGLELIEDAQGLRVFARLAADDPDVQSIASKMRLGIIDQMSFAFRVGKDEVLVEENADLITETRTILEVSDLYDVCVCAQGAYPQTDATLRSLAPILGRAGIDPAGLHPHRSARPAEGVPSHRSPEGGSTPRADLSVLRARATAARITFPNGSTR